MGAAESLAAVQPVLQRWAEYSLCPPQPAPDRLAPYTVELKRRQFIPPGVLDLDAIRAQRRGSPQDTVHFLLQLRPASPQEEKALRAAGVTVRLPVGSRTFLAWARVGDLERLRGRSMVRAALPLLPEDRLELALAEGRIGPWARTEDGRIVLDVVGFEDVPMERLQQLVERAGGEVEAVVGLIHTVTAKFPPGAERGLIQEDEVQWVAVTGAPLRSPR